MIVQDLNGVQPGRVVEAVESAKRAYACEAGWFSSAQVCDVFIVGSAITDEFVRGESDVDLCISVSHPDETGVVIGFDTFLREEYQSTLQRGVPRGTPFVDIGVYTSDTIHEHVDDETVFSCVEDRFLTL